MIKLSVMYPNGENNRFDIAYYLETHIALVRRLLGPLLQDISVDEGIAALGTPAPYLAMGHLLFNSMEDMKTALDTHGQPLMADIPNYTNSQPTIQISEVKL
jgi:uncharacterized protein (TIGR02118 family)